MKQELRWYDFCFIALFLYFFALQLQAIWPFTVDDMYIPLRYAKNWVAGNGLVWNVHELPVEGYSNFSFVVLGAVAMLFDLNPVFILKSAGVIGLLSTVYFIYLISRFWLERRESYLPCLALLIYKGQIIWAASGLETTVYEALVCGSVYFCLRGMGYQYAPLMRRAVQNNFFVFAGIFLALAGLTRPEAPALMILFFILICWDGPKTERSLYWRGIFYFCLSITLIYAPYFIWRLYYFGYLFPNPVYCKGLTKEFTWVLDINFLKLIWPFAILSVPACIRTPDRRHYFLWMPSVIYLLMLMGADTVVAFDNRLFLSPFALLLPLAVYGMSVIVQWYVQEKGAVYLPLLYFFFFVTMLFFMPAMSLANYHYFTLAPVKGERLRSSVIGWLNAHASSGDSVVLSDSGMIPYSSNLKFIDSYCLNNVVMAHSQVKQRYETFCKQVLLQKPDIVVLTSLTKKGRVIYTPADRCLKTGLDSSGYQLSGIFTSSDPESTYKYEVFSPK